MPLIPELYWCVFFEGALFVAAFKGNQKENHHPNKKTPPYVAFTSFLPLLVLHFLCLSYIPRRRFQTPAVRASSMASIASSLPERRFGACNTRRARHTYWPSSCFRHLGPWVCSKAAYINLWNQVCGIQGQWVWIAQFTSRRPSSMSQFCIGLALGRGLRGPRNKGNRSMKISGFCFRSTSAGFLYPAMFGEFGSPCRPPVWTWLSLLAAGSRLSRRTWSQCLQP